MFYLHLHRALLFTSVLNTLLFNLHKNHIVQHSSYIIPILQMRNGAQRGPNCPSAIYEVNDKSSNLKLSD